MKKPRTSADPSATSVKKESGSVDPESFGGLGEDQGVFENLPKISDEEVQEAMKKQGVWGEQSTHVDASKASEINDEFVTTSKKDLRSLTSRTWMSARPSCQTLERTSPTFALANQTQYWLLSRRWSKRSHLLVQAPAYDLQRYQDSDGASHSEVWLH